MGNFFTLISIENTKLWKRRAAKVMMVLMIIISIAVPSISKYIANKTAKKDSKTEISQTWKQDLEKQVAEQKEELKKTEKSDSKMQKSFIGSKEKSIAESEYRIKNDIKPELKESIWSKVSQSNYGSLIALFIIIACAAQVAGEFTEGTMKMMITRPYSRSEILTAKLFSSIIYGLELLLVAVVLDFVFNGIMFGFNGIGAKEMLWTGKNIVYMPAVLKTLILLGLQFLQILVYVILAFCLSAVFRSRSLATGFSLFLYLFATNLVAMLGNVFSWGKYLPFGAYNFPAYINQGAYIADVSLVFALVSALIYSFVFCFIGYYVFKKRDI